MHISDHSLKDQQKQKTDSDEVPRIFPKVVGVSSGFALFLLGFIVSQTSLVGSAALPFGALSFLMAVAGGIPAYGIARVLRKIHNKL